MAKSVPCRTRRGFGEKLINATGGKPEMEKRKFLKIPLFI